MSTAREKVIDIDPHTHMTDAEVRSRARELSRALFRKTDENDRLRSLLKEAGEAIERHSMFFASQAIHTAEIGENMVLLAKIDAALAKIKAELKTEDQP